MDNQDQKIFKRVPYTRELADMGEGVKVFNALHPATIEVHAIIDFETTGLKTETDEVIEMGIFVFGVALIDGHRHIFPMWAANYLNEPSTPITEEITKITGITQPYVAGKKIDWDHIKTLLVNVTHFAAHNAAFDRKFFNRYLPGDTRPWYCTSKGGDVDWQELGFNTAGLELLTYKHGYFYDAHRAVIDCAAVYWLICQRPELLDMVNRSLAKDAFKLRAYGAPMRVKDDLKARGYRWNPDEKVWWLIVSGTEEAGKEIDSLDALYFNARGTVGAETIPSNMKYLGD